MADPDKQRSFMDVVDGRAARALWRTAAFLMLTLLTILSFIGQGALGDIRDLKQLMSQVNVELARMAGTMSAAAVVITNHENRINKLEDWRVSLPIRGIP